MRFVIQQTAILILAAGQSQRLGRPKQLLEYEGQSLINRLIDTVTKDGKFPVTLVLGAQAPQIENQLIERQLTIAINENWIEGMAGSLKLGLEKIMVEQPSVDGVMILVCDQPFIGKEQIHSLIQLQHSTGYPMAACYYSNASGTPALFHKSIFPELMNLKGDTGARKIIKSRESEVAKLHFDKGFLDIDTEEDYIQLLKKGH